MLQYGIDTRGDAYNMQSLLHHCMHLQPQHPANLYLIWEKNCMKKNNVIEISVEIAFTRNCGIPHVNEWIYIIIVKKDIIPAS